MKSPNLDSTSILSSTSSGRRRNRNFSASPEFEFWMARNLAFPQPDLVAADDLFVDGVLQPLDLLHRQEQPDSTNPTSDPPKQPDPTNPTSVPPIQPVLSDSDPPTVSKRWKDIFKKSTDRKVKNEEKDRKRERKGNGVNGLSTAELNINIWPFSRSRSAGNGGSRPRMVAPSSRKISSAPCSRSNSAGESKSRKWPSSPSRGGVHLGRNSPVWQVQRVASRGASEFVTRNANKGIKKEVNNTRRSKLSAGGGGAGAKAKVLSINVPACIGYRSHLSCRSDEIERSVVVGGGFVAGGNLGSALHGGENITGDGGRGNSNLFNFRGLFNKKL